MAISNKVKSLLKLKGRSNAGLAEYLGISTQAMSNKFYRDSFSAADLVKISSFLECELSFVVDAATRVTLDIEDLKAKDGRAKV